MSTVMVMGLIRGRTTPVSAKGAAAVDGGSLFQIRRNRTDVVHQQEDRLGRRQRNMHQDQTELVGQTQVAQIFDQRIIMT